MGDGIVRAKSLSQLKDKQGKVIGFTVVEIATGKKYNLPNDFLLKNITEKKLVVSNLKVVTINGEQLVVDQDMLNSIVNSARREYEQGRDELMSNKDYDAAYDTLADMEKTSGVVAKDSATHNVGYEVVSELPKKRHKQEMLSLDKTKDIETLKNFLGNQRGVLGWKEDGLTVVLTYENGRLVEGVTRGNGEIGEVITPNIRQFKNVPLEIPFKGHLIMRGEALIRYKDFQRLNEKIEAVGEKPYKNPRNLCSGTIRSLDSRVTASRNVIMKAFDLVESDPFNDQNSYNRQLEWLKEQGFDVVEHVVVTKNNLEEAVSKFQSLIDKNPVPSDGLVLRYDDLAYGKSLGRTAKFPRHSLAFKWADDDAETTITDIEWSPSRTGLINPVAIFEPVELEGTTVTRASLHNVSIMEKLGIAIGSKVMVYKANMIIPQISRNLTPSDEVYIPTECPCCGGPTRLNEDPNSGVLTLMCDNPLCPVKGNKRFEHFVSRDAMNIDGISESTLVKLMELGVIEKFADLYHLDRYADEIMSTPGFGYKSYINMIDAIEKSRKVKVANLIYALGIPNIGLNTSKLIAKNCGYDLKRMATLTYDDIINFDGIGPIIAESYINWFNDRENVEEFIDLLSEIEIVQQEISDNTQMKGVTIAVHGSLYRIKRTALKELVENFGGKLVTSVNKSTTYLVTNQPEDNTNKVRSARSNGVAIISEDEFIEKFNLPV